MGIYKSQAFERQLIVKNSIERLQKHFGDQARHMNISFSASNPHCHASIRKAQPNAEKFFHLVNYNYCYQLCETYPAILALPISTTSEQATQAAEARSSSRLPAVVWTARDMPCIAR